MSIETAEDYNERLGWCGCCTIPLCPEPVLEKEKKTGDDSYIAELFVPWVQPAGLTADDVPTLYKTHETTTPTVTTGVFQLVSQYAGANVTLEETVQIFNQITGTGVEDGPWIEEGERFRHFNKTIDPESGDPTGPPSCSGEAWPVGAGIIPWVAGANPPADCTTTVRRVWNWFEEFRSGSPLSKGCPGPFPDAELKYGDIQRENYQKREISDPFTKSEMVSNAATEMAADDWTTAGVGEWSGFAVSWPIIGDVTWGDCATPPDPNPFGANAALDKIRFRFQIPSTHLGTYFKITYDIGEFPTSGSPSFVSQDNVVEWTGPGTGTASDPSWLTDWVEVDPPSVPGQRRVVNIRYTCRHGVKFPALPQVMGEALEI